MKKIIICGLVFLAVFIIYLANMDRKVYYLALGNSFKYSTDCYGDKVFGYSYYVSDFLDKKNVLEKYMYDYSEDGKRITDIYNDIINNKKHDNITMKNALVKADLVTLSINYSDILSKLEDNNVIYNDIYDYIDDLNADLDKLFKVIRQYCKEDIIFVGIYNPFYYKNDSDIMDVFDYLNKRFGETSLDYNIKYIDLSDIDNSYIPNKESFNLNDSGYRLIGSRIIEMIDKLVFEG